MAGSIAKSVDPSFVVIAGVTAGSLQTHCELIGLLDERFVPNALRCIVCEAVGVDNGLLTVRNIRGFNDLHPPSSDSLSISMTKV